jgi:hypothetical protein
MMTMTMSGFPMRTNALSRSTAGSWSIASATFIRAPRSMKKKRRRKSRSERSRAPIDSR